MQPQVGRLIHAEDEHGPNSAPYIVLSDSLWRSMFNADPRGTRHDGDARQRSLHGDWRYPSALSRHGPICLARLLDTHFELLRAGSPGGPDGPTFGSASPAEARRHDRAGYGKSECNRDPVGKGASEHRPGTPLRLVRPGLFADTGDVIRGFLLSVTGLALLVLAAACANLASLFAARAADRSRELALRVALGATRWRLVRQLLTEAMLLSMLGGAAGLVIAGLLLRVLNQWASSYGHVAVSADLRVCLAALILTLVSALLFGMIPARQVSQSSPLQAMKSGPVDSTPLHRFTLRDVLLGAQIAICMLLVTASLVAVRGMVRMLHAPLGFQPQGAMLADVDRDVAAVDVSLEKQKAMLEAVQRIPGVTTAGAVNRVPFTGGLRGVPIFPPGTTELNLNNSALAPYVYTMSPGYLEAAGTRLLSGRDVSMQRVVRNEDDAVLEAVVNDIVAAAVGEVVQVLHG